MMLNGVVVIMVVFKEEKKKIWSIEGYRGI